MMRNVTDQPDQPVIQGRLAWPADHPLMRQSSLINQMAATVVQNSDNEPESIAVTVGHAMQPQFAGTPEQQYEAARAAAADDPDGYLRVTIEPVAASSHQEAGGAPANHDRRDHPAVRRPRR